MRVECYYNLHKKCISVRHKGKVIAHLSKVFLTDVTFSVQKAGRERVLKENRKNVHAFVRGNMVEPITVRPDGDVVMDFLGTTKGVRYNPYHESTFVDLDGNPIYKAERCVIMGKRIYI